MKTPAPPQLSENTTKPLSNHEVVVVAAYFTGAESAPADTEDIAIVANKIAPGRFSWRKYKDQINIDAVRKRLWDATKPERGAYLIGSEKVGWRLTKAGYDFALMQIKLGNANQETRRSHSQQERAAHSREINRMLGDDAFKKLTSGHAELITRSDAERFFRVDDYVVGKARALKIERLRIIAVGNPELSNAIGVISKIVEEK